MPESAYNHFNDPLLTGNGLNMQAVLPVDTLPETVRGGLERLGVALGRVRTLVLFGNGGTAFWQAFQQVGANGLHPVDAFSQRCVADFMQRRWVDVPYTFLYPGNVTVPLQTLGQLAGWHHESPMKVGINDSWGLWYAYRALIAVEAEWPASVPVISSSPCESCTDKPCIAACPANALEAQALRLERCIDFRLQANSVCSDQCLARGACPVAPQHRYSSAQVAYHYGHSLPCLREWRSR